MPGQNSRLFARLISKNREPYALKILTLATAFASSVLIILFSLHEFGFDKFYHEPETVFRVVQKNTDEHYSGNRLSVKIPPEIINHLNRDAYKDSLQIARVKIMNAVTVVVNNKAFADQKIHAADADIINIFSFKIIDGHDEDFNASKEIVAMLSARAAEHYTGTIHATGKKLKLNTFGGTIIVRVVAVFNTFPSNTHEDFDVLISYQPEGIEILGFNPDETGLYGRALRFTPAHYKIPSQATLHYTLQPLPDIYFGARMLGEEAQHGDRYSVIILICMASLILFLALTSFVNLTTITLPHRSKELAVKKLAGTSQSGLLFGFLRESFTLVGVSLVLGLLILIVTSSYIESMLQVPVRALIFSLNIRFILIVAALFLLLSLSPVLMTLKFVHASPNRLLSTDTITFPRLKRTITFLQLGISIFLIITSVVVRRQINFSLVKEPGQNHDQVVYLNAPAGITNEGIRALRSGWKQFNPNIIDVMAVSQLPDRVNSKEVGSDFYTILIDGGFRNFFELEMTEGYWFGPNEDKGTLVTNRKGKELMRTHTSNVIGVVEDISGRFNQPEKPMKLRLAPDYQYNWLCVRVLEVDIRSTVNYLSNQFSANGQVAHVNYLNKHFNSWIGYQDRLNTLSGILTLISVLLSCCAIYGLSVSLVRDKLKQIAVHKLYGAKTFNITLLLVGEFAKQMLIALIIFAPLTYIILNELLRTFVYSTGFSWLDPIYPIGYCAFVITAICGFQALSLNRNDFASALKG
jgi:putative ABC transport system permease protein